MDIYFGTLDRKSIYQIPVLPPELPELSKAAKNEEFESYEDGIYNIIGNAGLISFSLESFIPAKNNKYPFAKIYYDNAYDLINLWSFSMDNKAPVRVVMYRNDRTEVLNQMVTVENMVWHEDKVGDIKYKVDFKEYRELD